MVARPIPYVPLEVIGSVPYRPIGSSHYIAVPDQTTANTPYVPSDMSVEALRKGLTKVTLKVCDFPIVYEQLLEAYFDLRLVPLWSGCKVLPYDEAVSLLTFDKSPGFPDYYTCEDKACALRCSGMEIKQDVLEMLYGAEYWLPFTVTLKDELRTADRVAAHKTRVFTASSIRHLLLGKMLFTDQEDRLRKTRGQHPGTIGISVPGPEYVAAVRGLSRRKDNARCWGFDIGGCDQTFLLAIARKIRDARKKSLPEQVQRAVDFYYNCTYCGEVICCGCVHRCLHQKSGQELTGDDTTLYGWGLVALYVMDTIGCPVNEADKYFQLLQNGDDGAVSFWDERLSGPGFRDWCAKLGVIIELEREEASLEGQITFLSNTLRERYVPGYGDIVVTAGNLTKLLSSIEWLRKNADFTLEENTLLHWCGLRIGLWPWKQHFDDLEERIDEYLKKIDITPRIVELLRCRVSSDRILQLHLRYEGGLFFTPEELNGVRSQFMSAIKLTAEMQLTKAEKARRAAQSARDKKQSSGGKQKDVHVKALRNRALPNAKVPPRSAGGSTGASRDRSVSAPAARGMSTGSTSRVYPSTKFKDGICIEGEDHLCFIAQPNPVAISGQCLQNLYMSPSAFGGTRLEKFAELYEKFMFEEMDFALVPSASSATDGDIGLSYDADVMDETPPASEEGIRQYTAAQYNCDANVWIPQLLKVRRSAPDSGYFTNPVVAGSTDDRLSYQGQIYVYCVTPIGKSAGVTLARLRVRYKCHLFTPQLENAQTSGLLNNVPAVSTIPTGTVNLQTFFTTAADLIKGNPMFLPKVINTVGNWVQEIPEGVYKILGSVNAVAGSATSAGSGSVTIDPPSITVKETPLSAAAPQPWIQAVHLDDGKQVTGDIWSSASAEYTIGIPKGGAYMNLPFTTDELITIVGGNPSYTMDIDRISNYVGSFDELFVTWVGAEECKAPLKHVEKAISRAKCSKTPRPLIRAPKGEKEERRRSAPPSAISNLALQFPAQPTVVSQPTGY